MRGTIVAKVKYPPGLCRGNGYIIYTDEGKLELWPEEVLERVGHATSDDLKTAKQALKDLPEIKKE